jgi:hypothetical protein
MKLIPDFQPVYQELLLMDIAHSSPQVAICWKVTSTSEANILSGNIHNNLKKRGGVSAA